MRVFPFFLLLTASGPPVVSAAADPLDTQALLPSLSARQLVGWQGTTPCAQSLPAAPLRSVDAVDLALCNHPQTREVWANVRAEAARVGVARSAWLPDLDGRTTVSRNETETDNFSQRNASLSFSWLVYDFGQRAAALDNAEQVLAAALASQDATVQSLFLAALQNYYTAQATRAAVSAALEAERSARESLAAAELRYQVGTATPADRLQAQTAASQARLNRQRAEGLARNALGALANALGLPAQTPIQLAEPPGLPDTPRFQRDVEQLIAEAQQRRPELKAAQAQVRAAEASAALARAQGRPTIGLSAIPAWQRLEDETTRGSTLGLTLTVPIFSGFATTYQVRAAQAQVDARAAQLDRTRSQVALDVWLAYQNLETATQALQTTQDLVASAEQSAQVALGRYRAGVGSVLDLLSAQTALADARVQRIRAELDWHVYRATLAQAVGVLDYPLLQASEGKP